MLNGEKKSSLESKIVRWWRGRKHLFKSASHSVSLIAKASNFVNTIIFKGKQNKTKKNKNEIQKKKIIKKVPKF